MNFLDSIAKSISLRDGKTIKSTFGEYFDLQRGQRETGFVSACTNTMGNYFAGANLRLYKKVKGSLREIVNHPFLDLWESPNNFQVSWEIKYFMGLYLAVKGNYYLLVLKGLSSKKPRNLIILDPMRVKPISSKSEWISHYEYDMGSEKVKLEKEELIHIRYPYSGSLIEGRPVIDSIADVLDVDKYQQALTKKFYKEGGFNGATFSTKASLTNSAYNRALEQLKTNYSGSDNAFKVALFDQDLQPIKAAYSIKDMDLTNQRKLTQEEVLMAFRMPKLLLGGSAEGYTKASAETAEYIYAQSMIDPLLNYVDQVLSVNIRFLYNDESLVVKHDSVAPKDVERKLKYYSDMVGIGAMTINEVREEEDYDPFPYALANMSIVNVGGALVNIATEEQIGQVPNNVPAPDEPQKDLEVSYTKDYELYWKQYDRRIRKELTQFSKMVKDFFGKQEKRLLESLNQKSVFTVENFFDSLEEAQIIMNMFENALTRMIERGMSLSGKINLNSAYLKNGMTEIIKNSVNINQTTKDKLVKKIKDADDSELKGLVNDTYKGFGSRVDLIALSTAESAFNLGLWAGFKEQGYKRKTWISQKDSQVRDSHALADGQTVGIDEAFNVSGEYLMYPGDPTASAEEIINCRCVLIGVKE